MDRTINKPNIWVSDKPPWLDNLTLERELFITVHWAETINSHRVTKELDQCNCYLAKESKVQELF